MAYIDPRLLDMARAQSNAIREKKELPYKAPYKYKDGDGFEREADPEWFDNFCVSLSKQEPVALTPTNEQPKLPQAN